MIAAKVFQSLLFLAAVLVALSSVVEAIPTNMEKGALPAPPTPSASSSRLPATTAVQATVSSFKKTRGTQAGARNEHE
ncbi:hypothetical protein BGZ58_008905 [Dissophora ornata]|nr:hypothetical protein BGZ58_008905 [Dissophora ornata]